MGSHLNILTFLGEVRRPFVPGAYYIGYTYTQRNQLASIGNFANFTYDASGNMTKRQGVWCYTNDANFGYDDMNRMTMAEQGGANGWIFARSHYQYDKVGRETATWRDEDTGSGSGWGERFEYENSDQVKKVFYNAQNAWTETPQNATNVQEYGYSADKLNRTSVSNNGITTGYTMPDGMNQYTNVGNQAIGYDNHFNIASYNGNSFTYDAENHLVGGSMQATYDGLGRCVLGQLIYEGDVAVSRLPFPVRLGSLGLQSLVFAPLIVDLDNRLNVNVHGNVRGRDNQGRPVHLSQQGLGPWEVNLQYILDQARPDGPEWPSLLLGSTVPQIRLS